jgi:hypothetical protein
MTWPLKGRYLPLGSQAGLYERRCRAWPQHGSLTFEKVGVVDSQL